VAALAGCVGCGGGGVGSQDSDVTETKLTNVRFDITGAAVGALGGPEDTARASWQKACDAWVAKVGEIAGAKLRDHDCGNATDVGGNDGYQFTSSPVAHMEARLAEGAKPSAFEPGPIAGSVGPHAVAYASWQAACDAALASVKAIYGDRLLGATCQLPKDIGGNDGWQMSSALSLWMAPSKGTPVSNDGWIAGTTGPRAAALASWRSRCDAWLAELAGRSGARFLDEFSCGEAKDVGDGNYLFTSATTARFVFPLAEGSELTTQELGSIQGASGPRVDAIASWQNACSAALDQAKVKAGDRFLAGVCHEPKDVGSGGWQYASPATVWLGDLAKTPPAPEPSMGTGGGGGDDGSTGDLKNSPVAANCKDRCVAMMNACNAGPIDQTCDGMCAYKPTEAQMVCAEATSCDHLEDWTLKCELFQ